MDIFPKDIIVAFIGAILGVAVAKLYEYILYLKASMKPHYLSGAWFGYYLTMKGGSEFFGQEAINLKAGKFSQFKMTA